MDANGIVTLLWEWDEHDSFRILGSQLRPGKGWSRPALLGTGGSEDVGLWAWDMAVGPSGAVVAAWSNADSGVMSVAYRSPNGRWSPTQVVPSARWPLLPHVTVDRKGLVTLAYQARNGHYRLLQRAGPRWREPVALPARGPQYFDIEAARAGEIVMIWKTRHGGFRAGRYASASWTAERLTGPLPASEVDVEAGPQGTATFVLNSGDFGDPGELLSIRQDRDGSLGPLIVVAPIGAACSGVSHVSNRHGRVLLAWISNHHPAPIYVASRRPRVDRWADPVELNRGGRAEPCYGQGVGLADDGSAVVTWAGTYTRRGSSTRERGFWVRRGTPAS